MLDYEGGKLGIPRERFHLGCYLLWLLYGLSSGFCRQIQIVMATEITAFSASTIGFKPGRPGRPAVTANITINAMIAVTLSQSSNATRRGYAMQKQQAIMITNIMVPTVV